MGTVAGVFTSLPNAEQVASSLSSFGLPDEKIVLLTPQNTKNGHSQAIPTSYTEQPGMGAAVGSVVGGAVGAAGGLGAGAALSAAIPGVGPIIAIGMLGAAVLGIAGAGVGGVAGKSMEDAAMKGLPADEWFVYEDALRKGRSVVLAFPDKEDEEKIQETMAAQGAESIDAARQQWWIGMRSAEMERYPETGRNFELDEKFFQMGFESALDPRSRGLDDYHAFAKLSGHLDKLRAKHPDSDVDEPFRLGFERGRKYYREMIAKGNSRPA